MSKGVFSENSPDFGLAGVIFEEVSGNEGCSWVGDRVADGSSGLGWGPAGGVARQAQVAASVRLEILGAELAETHPGSPGTSGPSKAAGRRQRS